MISHIPPELLSKKLAGLVLLLAFLLVLTVVAIVAWAIWGAPIETILGIAGGSGTAATGTHLTAQTLADRSANYNPPATPKTAPPAPSAGPPFKAS